MVVCLKFGGVGGRSEQQTCRIKKFRICLKRQKEDKLKEYVRYEESTKTTKASEADEKQESITKAIKIEVIEEISGGPRRTDGCTVNELLLSERGLSFARTQRNTLYDP